MVKNGLDNYKRHLASYGEDLESLEAAQFPFKSLLEFMNRVSHHLPPLIHFLRFPFALFLQKSRSSQD